MVELLRTHAGEGRLELDELEERVEAALAARTRGDLDALLTDLPRRRAGTPSRRSRAHGRARRRSAAALLPLLAGIAILIAAPAGVRLGRLDGDRLVVLRRPALGRARLRLVRSRQAPPRAADGGGLAMAVDDRRRRSTLRSWPTGPRATRRPGTPATARRSPRCARRTSAGATRAARDRATAATRSGEFVERPSAPSPTSTWRSAAPLLISDSEPLALAPYRMSGTFTGTWEPHGDGADRRAVLRRGRRRVALPRRADVPLRHLLRLASTWRASSASCRRPAAAPSA